VSPRLGLAAALPEILVRTAPFAGAQLLDELMRALSELTNAQAAYVGELTDERERLMLRAAAPPGRDFVPGMTRTTEADDFGAPFGYENAVVAEFKRGRFGPDGVLVLLSREPPELAAGDHDALRVLAQRVGTEVDRVHHELALRRRELEVTWSRTRLVEAGDEERRRIGRDLHDGAQQSLMAIVQSLYLAERAYQRGEEEQLSAQLEQARELAREISVELAELARGLHPLALDQGLSHALERLAARAATPVEMNVDLARPVARGIEATIYFVVAEALTNIAKHAPGAAATVDVSEDGHAVTVVIRDDGPGGVRPDGGSGVVGLHDRVEALGGTLQIDSPAGEGTVVRATLPLAPARTQRTPFMQIGYMGDEARVEAALEDLRVGRRRAVIAAQREWSLEGGPPAVGSRLDVVDPEGRRRAMVEITRTVAVRFGDLDESVVSPSDFAMNSIEELKAAFRRVHEESKVAIAALVDDPDWELTEDEPVVVQWVRVVD
jgi:signal transduction histidine kinase/uncharacterized protein YhfF